MTSPRRQSDFAVVRDSNGMPMAFISDESGVLCLVYHDQKEHLEVIELGAKFGFLPTQTVRTLTAYQAPDHTIYLVFAL
jgi:hypothetical protein